MAFISTMSYTALHNSAHKNHNNGNSSTNEKQIKARNKTFKVMKYDEILYLLEKAQEKYNVMYLNCSDMYEFIEADNYENKIVYIKSKDFVHIARLYIEKDVDAYNSRYYKVFADFDDETHIPLYMSYNISCFLDKFR